MAYLSVKVDGRESNYFEGLGAGRYSSDRRSGSMHGRSYVLGDLYYGFGPGHFYLRVDPIPHAIAEIPDFQLRLTMWDSRETRITLRVEHGKLAGCVLAQPNRHRGCHTAMIPQASYGVDHVAEIHQGRGF